MNAPAPKTTPNPSLADAIEDLFTTRGLSAGDLIPPTHELAKEFNVSRPVVREALAELTGRGLLNRQQGREGMLRVPGEETLGRVFAYRLNARDVSFSDLQGFRELLEVDAARLAAGRASMLDVAHLSDILHSMSGATTEEEMLAADVEFHLAVARIANPLYGYVLEGLNSLLTQSRLTVWAEYVRAGGDVQTAIERHAQIRDRIAAVDPEGAAMAMKADLADNLEGQSTAP
ncbi:FadR/GntR family transcriptional regulator [Herbiconiux sp. A18JL235]|uniref:FadR/GntR family transcriptional regulator n=1 Tax=Herbiconiux sp. A18JL235 TaxID=3152363 RepID=A0AB39BHX9_9MICO